MNPQHVRLPKRYFERAVSIGDDGEDAARATAFSDVSHDIIAASHPHLAGAPTALLALAGALAKRGILDASGFHHEAYALRAEIDGVRHIVVRACVTTLDG